MYWQLTTEADLKQRHERLAAKERIRIAREAATWTQWPLASNSRRWNMVLPVKTPTPASPMAAAGVMVAGFNTR